MLTQGGNVEATQDRVMIRVVPWFLDGYFSKPTMVCPKELVLLGPYLLTKLDHDPRLPIPGPCIFLVCS